MGFLIPHTEKPLRNLDADHLCLVKFPFSPKFFTEINESIFTKLGKIRFLSKF